MLSKQDIKKLSELSRIEITESETEHLQHDLDRILIYVDQLNRAEIGAAEALTNVTGLSNVAALDNARTVVSSDAAELLRAVPRREHSFVKVPPIWKKK
ncbi:MAG: hypothetical protein G01um101470_60 [Parcubacteria group bacterium Gr01-1014_70]|nr:MAG: hypothetical protein G01um101470_60 [Parcubacteria group bacterium Gr01-1014_70]